MASKRSPGAKPVHKELTAVELEMMNVIWLIGPCSVAQVQQRLRPQRELAYTSVSTIVRILEQKGYVTSEKQGRGHVYAAAVSKESYQALSLKRIVRKEFLRARSPAIEPPLPPRLRLARIDEPIAASFGRSLDPWVVRIWNGPLGFVERCFGWAILRVLSDMGVPAWISLGVTCALAVALGWLLHLTVELPARRFGRKVSHSLEHRPAVLAANG